MSEKPAAAVAAAPGTPGTPPPVLELSGVDVTLGSIPVLHDVSLAVAPGEIVALLGANGSGKSTLLRTAIGIVTPRRGSVRLFGQPVQDARAHEGLGYVPQFSAETGSIPATARETVASGLLGPRRWLSRARDPRVSALLADVGLADLGDRPITQMSGGQRQRVMIARALVRRPTLLVLDEPFSGVDLPTQTALAELLVRLRDRGTTLVVVLHEIGPLSEVLTRAVVLDQGRIVHDGPPEDRPLLDPGHDHPAHIEDCLGQELAP